MALDLLLQGSCNSNMEESLWQSIILPLLLQQQHGSKQITVNLIAPRQQLQQQYGRAPQAADWITLPYCCNYLGQR